MTAFAVIGMLLVPAAAGEPKPDRFVPAPVQKLREYVGFKHARTLAHTRYLEQPAYPVQYRWKRTWSVPYLRFLGRKWSGRAREAYELVVRLRDPQAAIRYVFGSYASQAIAVSSCETGGTFDIYANNGQYLGLFQMGSYARGAYGHSWTALGQARAAYRYFVASGRDWSPWECRP